MKKGIWSLLIIYFSTAVFFVFPGGSSFAGDAADGSVTVQGTGYPPIRAESVAQARLMARRAAELDVYRNAMRLKASPDGRDEFSYQELSGFVSGMTVVDEEYLKDGGVRVTARVPKNNVIISSQSRPDIRRPDAQKGTQRITIDEWYKVVRGLVRIEN